LIPFKADLHVHTCLSACADVTMSPRRIAEEAKRKSLDILGVCDHNSAENAAAVSETAGRAGIRVFPGLEITTREEVHLLALFESIDSALSMQEEVYGHLAGENDETAFGRQVIADAEDEVVGFEAKFLLGAVTLSLGSVVESIHALRGLAIAAHVDRRAFGLIGQLGFVPQGLALDALEISPRLAREEARDKVASDLPLVRGSDAHKLQEIGTATTSFFLEDPAIGEVRKALLGVEGRGFAI